MDKLELAREAFDGFRRAYMALIQMGMDTSIVESLTITGPVTWLAMSGKLSEAELETLTQEAERRAGMRPPNR